MGSIPAGGATAISDFLMDQTSFNNEADRLPLPAAGQMIASAAPGLRGPVNRYLIYPAFCSWSLAPLMVLPPPAPLGGVL
jgi:hypothetical protein